MNKKKIYARLNENKIVVKLFSDVFEQPLDSDILIEEGEEEYHAHVHLRYRVMDERGRFNYKFDKELIELSEEDKDKLFLPATIPKTEVEIMQEQLFNTQTELLQTQGEKDKLGNQLFEIQTILLEKGVL